MPGTWCPHSGLTQGRRISSRRTGPVSSPWATCAAAARSALQLRWARDRRASSWFIACCTSKLACSYPAPSRISTIQEGEIKMFGLTPLGVIHTAISLIAVAAGLIALFRDKEISPRNGVGKIYIIATVLTCLTGFGIFQHGGFGKPHALGIITLVVLGVAAAAQRIGLFGRTAPYVETVSYSATFVFLIGATLQVRRLRAKLRPAA